jgi:hypothetical protein
MDNDDEIGRLIYQHAKQEAEKAAAAAAASQTARVAASTKSKQHKGGEASTYLPKYLEEEDWMLRYKELVGYKQKFGNCYVNSRYKANPPLGRWVQLQRRLFKLKSLSKNRIAKLNEIRFPWKVHEDTWMARYEDLVEYKRAFGDCCVSIKYKPNPQLANWVSVQRKRFKSKLLAEDRIKKLDEIGFTWEFNKEEFWMSQYNDLVEYKREFGDCCVSFQYKANQRLGYWVANQRRLFKRKLLAEDRIAKLDEIGFTWEVNKEDA